MTDAQIRLMQLKNYQAMPLGAQVRRSEMLVREAMDHCDGQMYIAISGKDSIVTADIVWSLFPDVPGVYADTGNELDSVKKNIIRMIGEGRDITIVKPKMSFDEVVLKYGYPVVSKKVSDYVNRCRRTKNPQVLRRHLNGENADGTPSPMSKIPNKWQKLITGPFDVTNKCCGILKFNPTSEYAKQTGRTAFTGVMASNSFARRNSYLNHGGCNAFNQKDPVSRPIAFWTEQSVLEYILRNELQIPDAYGEIQRQQDDTLKCSEEENTGCKACLFGIQFDDPRENRIQRLARTEPESYRHLIEDLRYDEVMEFLGFEWRPVSELKKENK